MKEKIDLAIASGWAAYNDCLRQTEDKESNLGYIFSQADRGITKQKARGLVDDLIVSLQTAETPVDIVNAAYQHLTACFNNDKPTGILARTFWIGAWSSLKLSAPEVKAVYEAMKPK